MSTLYTTIQRLPVECIVVARKYHAWGRFSSELKLFYNKSCGSSLEEADNIFTVQLSSVCYSLDLWLREEKEVKINK